MTITNGQQQKTQAMQRAQPADPAQRIAGQLDRMKDQLRAALPKHLTPERMSRVVLTSLRQTPALLNCTPASLFGAVFQASQLGLEVGGGLGHAYLVPYGKECTLVVGYKGLIDLARRSGQVSTIYAYEVREGDRFKYALGLAPTIDHEPSDSASQADAAITHVYAVAKLKDGGVQFEVMTRAQVDAIRARSRASKSGPWVTDYAMMARKTVLRRLSKLLPASIELQRAIALDEQVDANLSQTFDVELPGLPETIDAQASSPEVDPETGEIIPDGVGTGREPGQEG